MTEQLQQWRGEFGVAYTDRNETDWRTRTKAFHRMLQDLEIRSVLEVGCNRGHNLVALRQILGGVALAAVEPNPHALRVDRSATSAVAEVCAATVFELPFVDRRFDLVFTAGVLIHIAPPDLPAAIAEIYRVSRHYILAVEYYASEESVIAYRGKKDLLWKRDFLRHYLTQFPQLALRRNGFWAPEDGFDNCHWWLLEKP